MSVVRNLRYYVGKHWFEALVVFLLTGVFLLLQRYAEVTYSDPDRYYHLALSRETVKSGKWFLEAIPAIEGLGWNYKFVEKEFLFHQVTTLGYRLAREEGAALLVSLFAILTYLVVFRFALRFLPRYQALAVLLAVFCTPILLLRFYLLRPHVIALFAFSLLLYGFCTRRHRLVGFACLVFALAYHAFYIPAIVLGIVLGIFALLESTDRRQHLWMFLFGAGGIALGIFCNPYFPANFSVGFLIAKVPFLLDGELKGVAFGSELYPLGFVEFLQRFSISVLCFLIGGAFFFIRVRKLESMAAEDRRQATNFACLLAVNALFLLLTLKSPRAGEYLILSTGFLLVPLLYFVRPSHRTSTIIMVLFLAHLGNTMVRSYQNEIRVDDSLPVGEYLRAVDAFPAEPKGAKVFNCEWDHSPYLFYRRPDLRFIDILDPSLLYFHDRSAFTARQRLLKGEVEDVYHELSASFAADYVFCSQPRLVRRLQRDLRFRELYPRDTSTQGAFPHLFELVPGLEGTTRK